MNLKDLKKPFLLGTLFFILIYIFKEYIKSNLNNFSGEILTIFSLLFGLSFTTYSMLFGIAPLMKKDFRESSTFKDINSFFKFGLFVLLFGVVISLIYLFYSSYIFLVSIITIMGISIGFFYEAISLIGVMFDEANNN